MTTSLVGSSVEGSSVESCDASVLPSPYVVGVASAVGGSSSFFILPRIFTRATAKMKNKGNVKGNANLLDNYNNN